MPAEPARERGDVPLAGGDGEHRPLGVVDARRPRPGPAVDLGEETERDPGGALVAIRERMVLRESTARTAALSTKSG
jgi:hypothetical protein